MKFIAIWCPFVCVFCGSASAAVVEWPEAGGGNGHAYQAVSMPGAISWTDAAANAEALGGYLATITSAEENAFVFGLVNSAEYWYFSPGGNSHGPWLGGFTSNPRGAPLDGWQWLNNEGAFSYANWAVDEPNNQDGQETRLHFFGSGFNNMQPTWNDAAPVPTPGKRAYVVEFDSIPVPEPGSWVYITAFGGLVVLRLGGRAARATFA